MSCKNGKNIENLQILKNIGVSKFDQKDRNLCKAWSYRVRRLSIYKKLWKYSRQEVLGDLRNAAQVFVFVKYS
jgi:hypothetical protein